MPILQDNIPRALGAKESILETLIDELKDIPFIAKDFKSAVKKISNDQMKVEISNDQLEWIKQDLRSSVKSYAVSTTLMFSGVFTLLYDKAYKEIALALFVLGVARIFYK